MKNSFVMYTDYLEQTEMLSDEQMGVLFRSILEYVSGGEVPEMDPLTQMAFNFIKVKIDRDCTKYEETCEKRREAGRKGGIERAKRAQANASKTKQIKQNQANQADNDNDNDNENDNENENDNHSVNIAKDSIKAKDSKDIKGNTPLNPPKGKTKADQMLEAFKRMLPDYNFSMALTSSIEDWCTYKIEKKQPYTETGTRKFLNEVDKQWKAHGESAVIDIIDQTMASGYQGVTWDRISRVKPMESTVDRVQQVRDW